MLNSGSGRRSKKPGQQQQSTGEYALDNVPSAEDWAARAAYNATIDAALASGNAAKVQVSAQLVAYLLYPSALALKALFHFQPNSSFLRIEMVIFWAFFALK